MTSLTSRIAVCCLVFVGRATATVNVPGVQPTEKFEQSLVLDNNDKYILFWNYNDTHVTFEVHVKTLGYVGLGISGNGEMFPADVVIGWISNGTTFFADRHATGHEMPRKDSHQDWHLLYSAENDFSTVLKFVRKIDTCDTPDDEVIQEGTVRLIYSYSDTDPVTDDVILHHGVTRGTKSVSLLSGTFVPANMPSDLKYYDLLNQNFIMPTAKTTYRCRTFVMPDIGGQHHMIGFKPVITPGNEANIHHILLYRCPGIDPSWADVTGNCYDHRPRNLPECNDVIAAWAIGGEPMYFPDNVGFSVNGPTDPSFYVTETHYDNPTLRSGVVDNSGLRLTLTKTLRPIEAGLLFLGFHVDMFQLVPPHQKSFVSESHCTAKCIEQGLKDANQSEIRIFGALQHAHLLGVGITTRHFRNGTELKPIMTDPNYDFNFQEYRSIKDGVVVKPGDSIHVDCKYDSSKKAGVTFGGLSTHDEMCLTFAYYYPKMRMSQCQSEPTYDTYHGYKDYQLYQLFSTLDWSNATVVADFKDKLRHSTVKHRCRGDDFSV